MNDSAARVFGNVFIAAALVLVVVALTGQELPTAVIGVGLLVGGGLLRIEAAIVRGQPPAPGSPRRDAAHTWRRPRSEVLHLPEPTDHRPWQEPDGQDGPEPSH